MNVGSTGKTLAALTSDLARKWEGTRVHWNDAKSEEFERRYLDELVTSISRAGLVFEQLEKVLEKVRRDCE